MEPSYYETRKVLDEYLLFHYGAPEDQLPWSFGPRTALAFPARCVTETVDRSRAPSGSRALDVGCAVGRSSFELSAFCAEVIGIDQSRSFIDAAKQLAEAGEVAYEIAETGTIMRPAMARIPAGCDPSRVQFEVGDAMDLREGLGSFDIVLACNLLCRLPEPRRFLGRLAALVRPGGQLVLTTPHTWAEAFTARKFWLGATPQTGEPLEALSAALENSFGLERQLDLPFLIRKHRRKYQWSVAEATVWRRLQAP